MNINLALGLTFSLLLSLLSGQVSASSVIYQDVTKDGSNRSSKPTRIKLKKEPSLSLGRIAGIWGSVDAKDKRDAFFFGKTAGKARLRITLTAAPDMPPVTLKVSAADGNDVQTEMFSPKAGETIETWVRLKGEIQMDVLHSAAEKSYYALYVWYPGDRFDGLTDAEFSALHQGEAPKRPSFVRQLEQSKAEAE